MATQRIVFLSFVFIFNATFKNHLLSSTHLLWLLVGIVAAIWIQSFFFNSLYRKYCACMFVFFYISKWSDTKNTLWKEWKFRVQIERHPSIFFPYTVKCRLLVTQRYTEWSDETRVLLVSRNNNFSNEQEWSINQVIWHYYKLNMDYARSMGKKCVYFYFNFIENDHLALASIKNLHISINDHFRKCQR